MTRIKKIYNLKCQTICSQVNQNILPVGKQVRAAWWAPPAATEWMTHWCTYQVHLLLSFISNIIVVYKAESISPLTSFVKNEKIGRKARTCRPFQSGSCKRKWRVGVGHLWYYLCWARCTLFTAPFSHPARPLGTWLQRAMHHRRASMKGQMAPERVQVALRDSLKSASLVWLPGQQGIWVPTLMGLDARQGLRAASDSEWGLTMWSRALRCHTGWGRQEQWRGNDRETSIGSSAGTLSCHHPLTTSQEPFSHLTVHKDPIGIWLKCRFWRGRSGMGPDLSPSSSLETLITRPCGSFCFVIKKKFRESDLSVFSL